MKRIIVTLFALLSISCTRTPSHNSNEKSFLPSGQIVLSRPAPDVSEPSSMTMMGFLPVIGTHTGVWLSMDLKSKNLNIMDGNQVISTAPIEGGDSLKPGSYQIMHMQRNALWYAPDSYFSNRQLEIPGQGDKARFRRGALGDYAIFINKDTPIHSGPVWSEEVGGIRMSETALSKIYYQVQVGSIIEIK